MRLPGHVLNPPLEVVNHASNEAAEDEERIVALVVTLPKVRLNLGKAGAIGSSQAGRARRAAPSGGHKPLRAA